MCFRNRDFDELVELGAQIGVKIRERDDNPSDTKVRRIIQTNMLIPNLAY